MVVIPVSEELYKKIPAEDLKKLKDTRIQFRLKKFSNVDLSKIIPTLSYTYNVLPGIRSRLYDKSVDYLYDIEAFLPEMREIVEKTSDIYIKYFNDYIQKTSVKKFSVRFYVEKVSGIDRQASLLSSTVLKSTALPSSFKKTEFGQPIAELAGDHLEFTIKDGDDVKRMVINILYYMIKYDCVAAVNEGENRADGDLLNKYVLIASPSFLLTADYLRTSTEKYKSLKRGSLSDAAQELYSSVFKVDLDKLYKYQKNEFTKIWDKYMVYSPYLMMNSEKLKEFIINTHGNGDLDYINNLI